jgi:hypothetical protein
MGYSIFYRTSDICNPGIYEIIKAYEKEKTKMISKINNKRD